MINSNHEISADAFRGKLLKQESLASYTSWRTGGCADYIYVPRDSNDLKAFIKSLPKAIPVYWLGLGSNTLVRDGGFPGVVIVTIGALKRMDEITEGVVRAEAGVSAAQLARYTARLNLAGLEFMAGIPGTVGGALAMNAGCFGGETWEHVVAVEVINRQGVISTRMPREYKISYRSVEKPDEEWFIAGHFKLQKGEKEKSLEQIRNLLARRSQTQPTGTANCGSVFRNPPQHYAGQLIEACGLKGFKIGGARVSEKHANFIINEDTATAADIETLINTVKEKVARDKQIELTPEVCIIGRSA